MAIEISNGFTTFNTFVQFAEHRNGAGLKEDVAKAVLDIDQRHISTVTVSSASSTNADWFSRTGNDKTDNDRTRDIFKAAIADMSLSRDAITGAVTIHYSSPASLPVETHREGRASARPVVENLREAAEKLNPLRCV